MQIVKQAKVSQILGVSGGGESADKRRGSAGKEKSSRRGSRESLDSMHYETEEVRHFKQKDSFNSIIGVKRLKKSLHKIFT